MFKKLLGSIVSGGSDITEDTWEELEALLIQSDMGVGTTIYLVDEVREQVESQGIRKSDKIIPLLREVMSGMFTEPPAWGLDKKRMLTVLLMVGVNGSGKTTTLGKLAFKYRNEGRKVAIVAGDTFRAAAIEQVQEWGERAGVPVIAGQPGSDAASMVYDSIRHARSKSYDLLLVDTAGRLHNKFNLMKELEKVYGVCEKNVHQAPHEVLLVLDAPTGQNGLLQAQKFKELVGATGVVLTKLDGSAKGGVVFSIYRDLKLPIRYVGMGEGLHDLVPFEPHVFLDSLFEDAELNTGNIDNLPEN